MRVVSLPAKSMPPALSLSLSRDLFPSLCPRLLNPHGPRGCGGIWFRLIYQGSEFRVQGFGFRV